MKDEFTPAETQELIRLLKKIQACNYWVPSLDAWQEVQRTFSRWALELVIVDGAGTAPRILLTRYAGDTIPEHKHHFHIPGGFEKFPENIRESCSRVAKDELGVDVEYQGVLGIHKWTPDESRIGSRMLSVFVACRPEGDIITKEDRRFFTREEMLALGSHDMFQNHPHRTFLDEYLQSLESGLGVVPLKAGL